MNARICWPQNLDSKASAIALSLAVAAACSGGGQFSTAPQSDAGAGGSGGFSGSGGASSSGGQVASGGVLGGGGLDGSSGDGSSGGGDGGEAPVDAGPDSSEGGPAPECDEDADCAAFACDSAPRCSDGACALGTCNTADAGACTAVCVRRSQGASCVVMGKDADGDGHRDALCAENPGGDCDDTRATVHEGAAETCDGLDNDCSGSADDGLPLGGTATLVREIAPGKSARLGLIARPGGYALLTADLEAIPFGKGDPTELRLLAADGGVERVTVIDSSAASNDAPLNDPAFTFNGSGYLALTATHKAQSVTAAGAIGGYIALDGLIPYSVPMGYSIAAGVGGSSAAVWAEHQTDTDDASALVGRIIDASGNKGPLTRIATATGLDSFAGRAHAVSRGAAGYAITWVESQFSTVGQNTAMKQAVHLTLTDSALGKPVDHVIETVPEPAVRFPEQLQGEKTRPQVVVEGSAFVVGYLADTSMRFKRVDAAGTVLCGPTVLSAPYSWAPTNSLIATAHGVLFAATRPSRDTALYRVSQPTASSKECVIEPLGSINATGRQVAINNVYDTLGDTVMAQGADGRLALVWVEREASASPSAANRVMIRLLGRNLCD